MPKHAKLTVEEKTVHLPASATRPASSPRRRWLRMRARNGRIQMAGETVEKGKRARASAIRSMVDILRGDGYTVLSPVTRLKPEDCRHGNIRAGDRFCSHCGLELRNVILIDDIDAVADEGRRC